MYKRTNVEQIQNLPHNWKDNVLELWRSHPSAAETPYQASKRLIGRSPVNPIKREVLQVQGHNVNVAIYQGGWVVTDFSNGDGTRGGSVGVLIEEVLTRKEKS